MRVTNLMMTTGMLNNIMSNKADMNKKFDQYTTRQKIQNPSDDPVVAIRSLKYRANLSEVEQYLDKNVEDAESWMDLTESALRNMDSLLSDLYDKCVAGASDSYETIDRDSMEQQLLSYKEEIYKSLNADNAGRYIFSGYRTDTSVCYTKDDSSKRYTIKEPLTFQNVYQKTYITGGATYEAGKDADYYKSKAPSTQDAYILDLGYKKIEDGAFSLKLKDKDGNDLEWTVGGVSVTIDGVGYTLNMTDSSDEKCFVTDTDDDTKKTINVISDTGQIVVPKELYDTFRTAKSINTEYSKSTFETGDVRPEMYYDCTAYEIDSDGNRRAGAEDILYTKPKEQSIEYNVNFGQSLKVNVLANEALNSSYARAIDNIMEAVNDAYKTQTDIENVKNMLADSNNDETSIKNLTTLKEQLETELTLKKDILRKSFANSQTATKAAQSGIKVADADGTVSKISVSIATTSIGSRSARLSLIQNRLQDMKTNYTELRDNNECVDLETAIVNYNAAETTYNASLSAAAKVVKNSLLDFL